MQEMVKEEMEVLRMADAPGAEIDVYVSRLDAVLSRKVSVIQGLQTKLAEFRSHLQEVRPIERYNKLTITVFVTVVCSSQ